MSNWIWLLVMILFGIQMFIIGTFVDPSKWSKNGQFFWSGLTFHSFTPLRKD